LTDSNLSNAKLTGVIFDQTQFENWNISNVICFYFYFFDREKARKGDKEQHCKQGEKIRSMGATKNSKRIAIVTEIKPEYFRRVPEKGHLKVGEFEDRFKSRPTIEFIFEHGIPAAMGSVEDEWIRITDAAKILGVAKGTISRWANKGKIRDNGKKERERRVSKLSVLSLKHKREREDVLKDAAEDLQDRASKIPDRH